MPHEIAAALIVHSGMILLGKRSAGRAFFPDVWDVFGGHVEPGEGLEAALLREVQEELGVTPTHWTFLETIRQPLHTAEGPDVLIAHLYLVTEWTGRLINRQPEEHSQIRWFTLAEALRLELADPSYPELFARTISPL
jgi:mutator protein MutT